METENILEIIKTINDQILNPLPSDPEAVADYLLVLGSLKASINEVIPRANMLYNNEVATQTEKLLKETELASNSSAWKNLLKGKMATLQNLIDLCDRVRSTIETHIKLTISYLSYMKQRP